MSFSQSVADCGTGICINIRPNPQLGAGELLPRAPHGETPHGLTVGSVCPSKHAVHRTPPPQQMMITRFTEPVGAQRTVFGSQSVDESAAQATPAVLRKLRRELGASFGFDMFASVVGEGRRHVDRPAERNRELAPVTRTQIRTAVAS